MINLIKYKRLKDFLTTSRYLNLNSNLISLGYTRFSGSKDDDFVLLTLLTGIEKYEFFSCEGNHYVISGNYYVPVSENCINQEFEQHYLKIVQKVGYQCVDYVKETKDSWNTYEIGNNQNCMIPFLSNNKETLTTIMTMLENPHGVMSEELQEIIHSFSSISEEDPFLKQYFDYCDFVSTTRKNKVKMLMNYTNLK